MHVMLFLAGLFALAAGIAMLVFGIAAFQPDIANTLMIAANVSIMGGLILIGLGATVSRLRRIAEALEVRPVPRSLLATPAHEASAAVALGPVPEPQVDTAKLRGEQSTSAEPQAERARAAAVPLAAAFDAPVTSSYPATKWPRVDAADRLLPGDESAESMRIETAPPTEPEPGPDADRRGALAVALDAQPTVLKSGVIEGMAYTLYSDGSVEAELPQGTMRFGSIAEWRVHMRAPS